MRPRPPQAWLQARLRVTTGPLAGKEVLSPCTFVSDTCLRCTFPPVAAPCACELQVTLDGQRWSEAAALPVVLTRGGLPTPAAPPTRARRSTAASALDVAVPLSPGRQPPLSPGRQPPPLQQQSAQAAAASAAASPSAPRRLTSLPDRARDDVADTLSSASVGVWGTDASAAAARGVRAAAAAQPPAAPVAAGTSPPQQLSQQQQLLPHGPPHPASPHALRGAPTNAPPQHPPSARTQRPYWWDTPGADAEQRAPTWGSLRSDFLSASSHMHASRMFTGFYPMSDRTERRLLAPFASMERRFVRHSGVGSLQPPPDCSPEVGPGTYQPRAPDETQAPAGASQGTLPFRLSAPRARCAVESSTGPHLGPGAYDTLRTGALFDPAHPTPGGAAAAFASDTVRSLEAAAAAAGASPRCNPAPGHYRPLLHTEPAAPACCFPTTGHDAGEFLTRAEAAEVPGPGAYSLAAHSAFAAAAAAGGGGRWSPGVREEAGGAGDAGEDNSPGPGAYSPRTSAFQPPASSQPSSAFRSPSRGLLRRLSPTQPLGPGCYEPADVNAAWSVRTLRSTTFPASVPLAQRGMPMPHARPDRAPPGPGAYHAASWDPWPLQPSHSKAPAGPGMCRASTPPHPPQQQQQSPPPLPAPRVRQALAGALGGTARSPSPASASWWEERATPRTDGRWLRGWPAPPASPFVDVPAFLAHRPSPGMASASQRTSVTRWGDVAVCHMRSPREEGPGPGAYFLGDAAPRSHAALQVREEQIAWLGAADEEEEEEEERRGVAGGRSAFSSARSRGSAVLCGVGSKRGVEEQRTFVTPACRRLSPPASAHLVPHRPLSAPQCSANSSAPPALAPTTPASPCGPSPPPARPPSAAPCSSARCRSRGPRRRRAWRRRAACRSAVPSPRRPRRPARPRPPVCSRRASPTASASKCAAECARRRCAA